MWGEIENHSEYKKIFYDKVYHGHIHEKYWKKYK